MSDADRFFYLFQPYLGLFTYHYYTRLFVSFCILICLRVIYTTIPHCDNTIFDVNFFDIIDVCSCSNRHGIIIMLMKFMFVKCINVSILLISG